MKGHVSKLSEKGFGFIRVGATDYFFHHSSFMGHWADLEEDMGKMQIEVQFDVEESNKGPRATNVRRLDHPNQG